MSEQEITLEDSNLYTLSQSEQSFCEAFCAAPNVDSLTALDGRLLEVLVAYLLQQAGYTVHRTAYNQQEVADLIISQSGDHPLRGGSQSVIGLVQVKRQQIVPSDAIYSFFGHSLSTFEGRSLRHYYITSGTFTLAAYDTLARLSQESEGAGRGSEPIIRLIDGERLLRYAAYVSHHIFPTTSLGLRQAQAPLAIDDLFEADLIHRALPGVTSVLTVSNNKGGVGKTTVTLNLATAFAKSGSRVLVVDADSQANLTAVLLGNKIPSHTITDFVQGWNPGANGVSDLVVPTNTDGLSIIPGTLDQSLATRNMTAWDTVHPASVLGFARDLHEHILLRADPPYDWVLIDTAPSLGGSTMAALAAAHYVLAPIRPDKLSIRGVNNLQTLIIALDGLMGMKRGPRLLGCLLNAWRPQDELVFQHTRSQLEQEKIQLFGPIPYLSERDQAQFDVAAKVFSELSRQISRAVRAA